MQSFSKLDEQEEGAVMSQEEYIASIIDLYKDTFETEADMEAFKLELLGASTDEHPQDVFEKLENENVSIKSDFKLESESENEAENESESENERDKPNPHLLFLNPSIQKDRQSYYIIHRTWASDPTYISIHEEQHMEKVPATDTVDANRTSPIPFSKAHLVYQSTRPKRESASEDMVSGHPARKTTTPTLMDYPHIAGDLLPFIFPLFDQKPGASSPVELFYSRSKMNDMIASLRSEGLSSGDYRALAAKANRERAQAFAKASAAYQRGRQANGRGIAGYYSEEGRKWTHQMLACHQRAALYVLLENHPKGTKDTLDLHGLLVHESSKLLFPAIEAWHACQSGLGFPSTVDNQNYQHAFSPESRTFEQFLSPQLEKTTELDGAAAWDERKDLTETRHATKMSPLPATQGPRKSRHPATPLTLITGVGHHSQKSIRLKPELTNLLRNNGKWQFDTRVGSIVVTGLK